MENQPLAKATLTHSYQKILLLPQRHQIKYAPICFTVNLGMTGHKALSAHKNMTLKLLRDCQARLAKLDNAKKDHKC